MLFDLKGRRRRVVQATYLMLAILMGGGLVFFGIGGDVSGGLFDAFSDRSGSGSGLVGDRIEDNEEKVAANPQDKAALQDLVRDYYQLANDEVTDQGTFTDDGMEQLGKADEAWQQYIEAAEKPKASLASLMINVYSQNALNKPAEGAEAAEIITQADPKSAQAYLQLTQFAALAGQKRKAELAGQKAIELAPKAQRAQVKALVEQAKQPTPPTTPPSE